jgi:hypothetical protein
MKLSALSLLAAAALSLGCAGPQPVPLLNGQATPAAEGTVQAVPGPNGNTHIDVLVRHLAPPEKVAPSGKVYVVWVQAPGGPPQNIGALRLDENLTGRLSSVTPLQAFTLFVSPEQSPVETMPQGPRVLSAQVSPR